MDFSETIEVKVFDKEEHFSIDSYFFAYFHDIHGALDQIRDAVRAYRVLPERSSPQTVLDTTVSRNPLISGDRTLSLPLESTVPKTGSGFRLTSLLRPFQDTLSRPTSQVLVESPSEIEDFTHISRRVNSASFIPITTSPKPMDGRPASSPDARDVTEGLPKSSTPALAPYDHTYPPSTSTSPIDPDNPSLSRDNSSWSVGVPSWLKGPRRVFGSSTTSEQTLTPDTTVVREMYSSTSTSFPSSRSTMGDLAFSILETPDIPVDVDATEKFRTAFAYDEKETLLGCAFKVLIVLASLLTSCARFPWIYISAPAGLWTTICID